MCASNPEGLSTTGGREELAHILTVALSTRDDARVRANAVAESWAGRYHAMRIRRTVSDVEAFFALMLDELATWMPSRQSWIELRLLAARIARGETDL